MDEGCGIGESTLPDGSRMAAAGDGIIANEESPPKPPEADEVVNCPECNDKATDVVKVQPSPLDGTVVF